MGCATPSIVYKTKYVPVDVPRVVCVGAKIEDSHKEPVELATALLPNVETDDDVELLAKTALDDVLSLDIAHSLLANEVDRLEQRCANEEQDANEERLETLESIDELNKP